MSKQLDLPSAYDVARLAGVSQAAVSRAFTPGAKIADATRSLVLKAARELGYHPNLLARSLITGRSGIIGVVIGNPRNTFYLEALDALSIRLGRAGLNLLVFTARAEDSCDALVKALLSFRVDSLLLMSASLSADLADQCLDKGISVIFFNRRPDPGKAFPSVTSANFLGAGRIAEHLLEQGYRKLAVIVGSEHSSTSREREIGFIAKVVSSGLPIPEKMAGGFGVGAEPAAQALLSRPDRPDAIFCTSDYMAMTAIETARYRFGLTIGRDVGIAGFDDTEGASWPSFDLTTYSQPVEAMMDKVTEIILDPDDHDQNSHFAIEGELIVRSSTKRE